MPRGESWQDPGPLWSPGVRSYTVAIRGRCLDAWAMISISKMPRGFFFESLSCRGVVSFSFTSLAKDVCAQMTTKPHGFHWQDTFQLCTVDEGPRG